MRIFSIFSDKIVQKLNFGKINRLEILYGLISEKRIFFKKNIPGYIHSLLHATLVTKDVHPKQFGS